MKLMRTEDAVGQILCHDITRIVKDGEKGPVFRKGHVIREEDIEEMAGWYRSGSFPWRKSARSAPPSRRNWSFSSMERFVSATADSVTFQHT